MSLNLEHQNEQDVSSYDREEEYRRAQQAGAEAMMVGRETLETIVRQGEQLQRAENMVDDTVYTAETANRLLRGMTWSGWLANKFSKPVDSPEYRNQAGETNDEKKSILKPLKAYETVPESCISASQSVQNYHANLQVLEDCETDELKGTCRVICDDMYRQARLKLTKVLGENTNSAEEDDTTKNFALQLQEDLKCLRNQQFVLQQISRGVTTVTTNNTTVDEKSKLFNKTQTDKDAPGNLSFTDELTAQQDQHLNTLSEQCRELGFLAGNISFSAEQQAEIVDSLDAKNETLHYKMNIMNRRTEQLIKAKKWGKTKAVFSHYATIRHKISGSFLSVDKNNDSILVLSNVLNEKCVFGIYTRRRFVGLQSKFNRRWVGQNLLGQLNCSASSFDRRQEWEVEGDNWSDTTLLLVSAGWGSGGYLLLDKEGKGIHPIIGGGDFDTKGKAPKWCISEFNEPA